MIDRPRSSLGAGLSDSIGLLAGSFAIKIVPGLLADKSI
jgi:hypothetical protein